MADGTRSLTSGPSRPVGTLSLAQVPTNVASNGFYLATGTLIQEGTVTVSGVTPGAPSVIRIDASGGITLAAAPAGIVAQQSWLILGLSNNAKATGGIDVLHLDTVSTGTGRGSALSGNGRRPRWQRGGGRGRYRTEHQHGFRINGCPIASVNCVLLTTQGIPDRQPAEQLRHRFAVRPDRRGRSAPPARFGRGVLTCAPWSRSGPSAGLAGGLRAAGAIRLLDRRRKGRRPVDADREIRQADGRGHPRQSRRAAFRSRGRFREALSEQRKRFGNDSPSLALPLMSLALQLSSLGQFPQADAQFAEAERVLATSTDRALKARLLHYRGVHMLNEKKPADAEPAASAQAAYTALVPPEALTREPAPRPVRNRFDINARVNAVGTSLKLLGDGSNACSHCFWV